MKTETVKRFYTKPELKTIKIDNQISMVMLSSEDPNPIGEPYSSKMPTSNNDPYKVTKG